MSSFIKCPSCGEKIAVSTPETVHVRQRTSRLTWLFIAAVAFLIWVMIFSSGEAGAAEPEVYVMSEAESRVGMATFTRRLAYVGA